MNEYNDDQNKKQGKVGFTQLAMQLIEEFRSKKNYLIWHNQKLYIYTGTHYEYEPNPSEMVRTFCRRNNLPQSNNLIGNVAPIVCNYSLQKFSAIPCYVGDEDFSTSNLIAYSNGLLDVRTRLLHNHTSQWVSTICLTFDYDKSATCPQWLNFLNQVFENDSEKIALLQEWCGYCLVHDTSQQKAMVFVGPPRTGKTTTASTLQSLIGQENSCGFNLLCLGERFGARKLVGKLVAIVGEVNLAGERDKNKILQTFNSIVGEDRIDIEEKYAVETPSQRLPTRFTICCNELPSFIDTSGAMSKRLLILDFNVSFDGKEDRKLKDKLLGEISGINNWALEGLSRLTARGDFVVPASSKRLLNSFRRQNSTVFGFLQDCLVIAPALNPGCLEGVAMTDQPVEMSGTDLYNLFSKWCLANGRNTDSLRWLSGNLKILMPRLTVEERGHNKDKFYLNLGAKP